MVPLLVHVATPPPPPDLVPDPVPDPVPLTPEQHAEIAWPWLKAQCAPSTWDKFVASVGVRAPEAKGWATQ